jgi:trk system potassium uptake protein TrkA
MKIIIAGAGDVGFHLAQLLSYENQDIVVIDTSQDVLDYAATHLDVLTVRGDASSISLMEQLEVNRADLFLAVTTSENTNLVAAVLAKKLGAGRTIARVQSRDYLEEGNKKLFRELGIDTLISPRQLAAREIKRLVDQCSFSDVFEFEGGKLSLVGLTIEEGSTLVNLRLSDWENVHPNLATRPIAVLRGYQTILPRGNTTLRRKDHVYFITNKSDTDSLEQCLGKEKIKIRNVMIVGGGGLALDTAKLLEQDYNVTLVESDKNRCREMADELQRTLIINGEPSNIDLLEEEGLSRMDAFIALTPNSETNIITSLTAKNHGVYKTIAQVENKEYVHISQDIGVDSLINKKLIAANNIFRFIRKGQIEAITSLNGVDAEIIEFIVHKTNQLTKKPLKELHFPETAIVGGVIRGEDSMIPSGDIQLQVGDRVIVFALPDAIGKVERLFR